MIIKKKRLNNIQGLGENPDGRSDVNPAEGTFVVQQDEVDNNVYAQELQNSDSVIENSTQMVQPRSNILEGNPAESEEDIDLFNLDNIDFSQRQERRRGDRRRGFRRVDERNLVSRAREEADSIREAAMKEGYEAGLEQSRADLAGLKEALGGFINAKQEVFEYIAPDILEISVDIAQKIIKKEIEQDPQVLFNTIVDVLKTLSKEETKVTLRVNPAEVNEVKQAVPELLNLAGIDTKVVVLSDEEINEGGCMVTTTNGIVDATIDSRIELVIKALREL